MDGIKSINLSPKNIVVGFMMILGVGGTAGFGPEILNSNKYTAIETKLNEIYTQEIENTIVLDGINTRVKMIEKSLEKIDDDLLNIHERVTTLEAFQNFYLNERNN